MRITRSSDWRDNLAFDVPLRAADVAAGEPARCAACPADSPELPRTDLWAVKLRHPTNPAGFVRFLCAAHTPKASTSKPTAPVARAARPRSSAPVRERVPRRPARTDVVRAMCPSCFVEVAATGECGMCGQRIN